jgi:D-alanine-D-alanine ligase
MKNIVIFCGGNSSEHEVSILSTKSILEVSSILPYKFSVLYISRDLKCVYISEPRLPFDTELNGDLEPLEEKLSELKNKIDLAFLAGIHGGFAEDGTLQKILSNIGIKFSGSDTTSSRLCMNKHLSTQVVVKSVKGVLIPQSEIIFDPNINYSPKISFPLIAKPNKDGSSNFVKIINNQKDLNDYFSDFSEKVNKDGILLQEFLNDGIELTCGCLQKINGEFISLPPVEIIPKKNLFFDYLSKYKDEGAIEICPPKSIDSDFSKFISQIAIDIHNALGCRLYSRSDFIYKDNKFYYLETNTLPGMTKNSLIPKEAKQVDMELPDLIKFLIENS